MIPILLVGLMQLGGAYAHLPKLTLFPKPLPMLAASAPVDRCSVHMPRMVIPAEVQFQMRILKPMITEQPRVKVPAPECPALESK